MTAPWEDVEVDVGVLENDSDGVWDVTLGNDDNEIRLRLILYSMIGA